MELITVLLSINLLIFIVGFIIIRKSIVTYSKEDYVKKLIENIKIEDSALEDCFSEAVMDIYKDVIKRPNAYILKQHTMEIPDSDLEIWTCNEIDNRHFYNRNNEAIVEELNLKLTDLDKVLLDKIVKSLKDRKKGLVTKFFI